MTRLLSLLAALLLPLVAVGQLTVSSTYDPAALIPGTRGPLSRVVVANRSNGGVSDSATNLSSGAAAAVTYRIHHTAITGATDLQLVYVNTIFGETPNPDPISIISTIEDASGNIYPVTYNGATTGAIASGGMLVSDPVSIDLAAGDLFYTRGYVFVSATPLKFPLNLNAVAGYGDGLSVSANATTGAWSAGTFSGSAYGPSLILGTPTSTRKPVVAIVGDSIAAGAMDATSVAGLGYILRGLAPAGAVATNGALSGTAYPHVRIAKAGESAATFALAVNRRYRGRLLAGCTHAVVEYGANDLGDSLGTIQANLTAIWNALAARGIKVYQTTLTPITTSSDSWTTVGNQTVTASETKRTDLNTWIRTTPAPLSGYFDPDAICTAASGVSGKWPITGGAWCGDASGNGLHPSSIGAAALAPSIIPSQFR